MDMTYRHRRAFMLRRRGLTLRQAGAAMNLNAERVRVLSIEADYILTALYNARAQRTKDARYGPPYRDRPTSSR